MVSESSIINHDLETIPAKKIRLSNDEQHSDNVQFPVQKELMRDGPSPPQDVPQPPLCTCRVPDTINVNDTVGIWNKCQARDSLDKEDISCSNSITDRLLARAHVRISYRPFCQYHWQKMYNHCCCPLCGIFCVKGKFFACKETDDMHLFHEHCGQNVDYCPHCGNDTFTLLDIDLDAVQQEAKARMSPVQTVTNLPFVSFLSTDIDTIRHKESEKQLHTLSLFRVAEGEVKDNLNKAIDYAKRHVSNADVKGQQFCEAIIKNNLPMVTVCLAKGIQPDIPIDIKRGSDTKNVQRALHIACTKDYRGIAYLLLQFGADVNALDSGNCSPLMYAVINNNKSLVQLLLHYRARVDVADNSGNTVLHFAAVQGHPEIMQLLLRECDNVHVPPVNGVKLNQFIEEESDDEEFSLINAKDHGGWTPLMWAAEHGKVDALEKLLTAGAKTFIKDNENNLALHWAVMSKADKVVEPIVNASNPNEINYKNIFGDTPLIIACKRQFRKMFEFLLVKGADYNIPNKDGLTPIDICRKLNDSFAVSLIEAKINLTQVKTPVDENEPSPAHQTTKDFVICRDLSNGKERYPIRVINEVDDENLPADFVYMNTRCETSHCNFNKSGLLELSCKCLDCGSGKCFNDSCKCRNRSNPCTFWYDDEGTLMTNYHVGDKNIVVDECTPFCFCPPTCSNRIAQHGMRYKLEVRRTIDRGWGLFSANNIPARRFVCEYIGEIIADQNVAKRTDDTYLFELGNLCGDPGIETFSIDARYFGNVARFINHSCDPNISPINVTWDLNDTRCPHICFFTNKPVKKGEELCFDYGKKFWLVKGEKFPCNCSSPKCQYSGENLCRFLESLRRPTSSQPVV